MISLSTWRASARLAEMLDAATDWVAGAASAAAARVSTRIDARVARTAAARGWTRTHMGCNATRRPRREALHTECLRFGRGRQTPPAPQRPEGTTHEAPPRPHPPAAPRPAARRRLPPGLHRRPLP